MTPDAHVIVCCRGTSGEDDVRRDMDLVRSILLKIDEAPQPISLTDLMGGEQTEDEINRWDYHVRMLVEQAGFLSGEDAWTYDGPDWSELNLTWAGHEFLDTIRNPEIWKQTKAGAAKAGGWTLKTLADIASAIIKSRVEKLIETGEI